MNVSENKKVFKYHPPKGDQADRYKTIRWMGLNFSRTIEAFCPESHEKTIAIDKLREVVMWANASIACNE